MEGACRQSMARGKCRKHYREYTNPLSVGLTPLPQNNGINDRVSAINYLPERRGGHRRTHSCPESNSKSSEFETVILFSVKGTGSTGSLCSLGHRIEIKSPPHPPRLITVIIVPATHYQTPIMCVSQKLFLPINHLQKWTLFDL